MPLPDPARTWLFVPAHRRAFVVKALASDADVVILDLEDAVPTSEKAAARAAVVEVLAAPIDRAVVVRVTADGLASDLDAALLPGVSGVVIAKATPDLVREAHARSERASADVVLVPMVEDVAALEGLDRIADASARVRYVSFGSLDFASDIGLHPDEAELSLDHVRQHLVLASRRAGLRGPIDGPVAVLGDAGVLGRRARHSKALGFQGMLLIHPEQIAPVREAFRPSPSEVELARRVVELYEDSYRRGIGAVRIDHRMIDAANIDAYRRVLIEAGTPVLRDAKV